MSCCYEVLSKSSDWSGILHFTASPGQEGYANLLGLAINHRLGMWGLGYVIVIVICLVLASTYIFPSFTLTALSEPLRAISASRFPISYCSILVRLKMAIIFLDTYFMLPGRSLLPLS